MRRKKKAKSNFAWKLLKKELKINYISENSRNEVIIDAESGNATKGRMPARKRLDLKYFVFFFASRKANKQNAIFQFFFFFTCVQKHP